MSRFRRALVALGEPKLQELVGTQTCSLLARLGDRSIAAGRLAEILERRMGADLLLESGSRGELIYTLPRHEAEQLADLLDIAVANDPWQPVANFRFRRGSAKIATLFDFFQVKPPAYSDRELASAEESILPSYGLFEYQRRAAKQTKLALQRDPRRILLHMPTGSGKTRTSLNALCLAIRELPLNSVVVWLAHSEELCDQAAEEFQQAWQHLGDRPLTLARMYGPHEVKLGELEGAFLVSGIQKLYSRSLSEQSEFLKLKQRVQLVVMDEAHKAVARTYQHVLDLLAPEGGPAGILGLSATPGRSWLDVEEDKKLARFFRRKKITLDVPGYDNPVEFLQDEGFLAKPKYEYIRHDPAASISKAEVESLHEGFDLSTNALVGIARDEGRNLKIINAVLREAQEGHQMLVFAATVEHAELLANVLLLKGYECAAISAKTSRQQRRLLIQRFRSGDLQILMNYGVLTTGFDAPNVRIGVIARPTQSVVLYSQMVGRVIRGPRFGGTEECKIVTVVDQLPGFRNIYEGFFFWEDLW